MPREQDEKSSSRGDEISSRSVSPVSPVFGSEDRLKLTVDIPQIQIDPASYRTTPTSAHPTLAGTMSSAKERWGASNTTTDLSSRFLNAKGSKNWTSYPNRSKEKDEEADASSYNQPTAQSGQSEQSPDVETVDFSDEEEKELFDSLDRASQISYLESRSKRKG